MTHVTAAAIDALVERARNSPRRRLHLKLHDGSDEPCQRLLNAVWPDSYIRPHRHSGQSTRECLIALRGRFALLEFDDRGAIREVRRFGEAADISIVEIPPDVWHTVVALTDGAVLFEAKAGPYVSVDAKTFAEWAPPEEDDTAKGAYLSVLRRSAVEPANFSPE